MSDGMKIFNARKSALRNALSCLFFCLAGSAGASEKERIVSIGGAVTEIIYALGGADELVARDSTSLYPQQASALPDVGYMRQLSAEGVLSVNPSKIILIEGSGPSEALDVLSHASVSVEIVPEGYDAEAIARKIKVIGEAIGKKQEAAKLAEKVIADVSSAAAVTAGISEDKVRKVLFVLSMKNGKIMAAGKGTAADAIIRLAGARNVADGFHGYKPMNDEALIAAAPDTILMMSNGGPGPGDAEILNQKAIAATPAGRDHNILRFDGLALLGFGPRTALAIRNLAHGLYGL